MKYLGTKIGKSFTWKQQISKVTIKLNKTKAVLSKLKHVLDKKNCSYFIVQYSNPIYTMLHVSNLKTLTKNKPKNFKNICLESLW